MREMKKLLVYTLPLLGLLAGVLFVELVSIIYGLYCARFEQQDAVMATVVVVLGVIVGFGLMVATLYPDTPENQGSCH